MTCLSQKALELFDQGYSCSESIVRAARELNIIDKIDIEVLNRMSSAFSGGMGGSGCLCGAVAGSQMVIGYVFGRNDNTISPKNVKSISKEFVEKFKEKRKATCCRVLTAGIEHNSIERRYHCASIVEDAAKLIENLINAK